MGVTSSYFSVTSPGAPEPGDKRFVIIEVFLHFCPHVENWTVPAEIRTELIIAFIKRASGVVRDVGSIPALARYTPICTYQIQGPFSKKFQMFIGRLLN